MHVPSTSGIHYVKKMLKDTTNYFSVQQISKVGGTHRENVAVS